MSPSRPRSTYWVATSTSRPTFRSSKGAKSPQWLGEPPLPVSGYTINIPRIHFEKLPGQSGLQLDPDVAVALSGADFSS